MKATEKQAKTKKKLPPYYKFGRPTKYKRRYCRELVKYFDVEYFVKRKITKFIKDIPVEIEVDVPNRIPLFEGFARSIAIDVDTIVNWTKTYPDFFGAYKYAKGLQKEMIAYLALNNYLNAPYAIFLSKNITDLRDKVETDVTSGGERVESFNLTSYIKELKDKDIDGLQREAQKQTDN